MKLAQWLRLRDVSQTEFGVMIGASQGQVSRYVNGAQIPRRDHMMTIEWVTKGVVKPQDFYDPPPLRRRRRRGNPPEITLMSEAGISR